MKWVGVAVCTLCSFIRWGLMLPHISRAMKIPAGRKKNCQQWLHQTKNISTSKNYPEKSNVDAKKNKQPSLTPGVQQHSRLLKPHNK